MEPDHDRTTNFPEDYPCHRATTSEASHGTIKDHQESLKQNLEEAVDCSMTLDKQRGYPYPAIKMNTAPTLCQIVRGSR
jgi:hypothetical protein